MPIQFSADCTITMFGSELRQGHPGEKLMPRARYGRTRVVIARQQVRVVRWMKLRVRSRGWLSDRGIRASMS